MRKLFVLAAVALLFLCVGAYADTVVFDLSPTNGVTSRGAGSGVGQGVIVDTTQTITSMGFYLDMPNGGNLKFMIWDANNANLLFSEVVQESPIANMTWVYADPFNFTLQAGQTYFFGVVGDASADIGYIYPPINYSANGLTAVTSGNANYDGFVNPVFSGFGAAEIGLRLTEGAQAPEPSSMLLLGSGLVGLAGVFRRKLAR